MNFGGVVTLSVLLVSIQLQGVQSASSKKQPRIVGGTTTSISKMKYMVNMRRSGAFICGGALVSPQFVVSAAHCVHGVPASALTIHGGSTVLSKSKVVRRVVRIFVPASFKINRLNNDVSVLKLNSPMTGANIATIPLCSHSLKVGSSLRIAGWGIRNENAISPSNRLRTAVIKLKATKTCRRDYSRSAITKSMMCAAERKTDSCSGDSGGPVVSNGQLCGIVSWGKGCAEPKFPGVYTNVNRVKAFITNSMKK